MPVFLAALLAACASTPAVQVAGVKPAYLEEATAKVPNMEALGRRMWVPALDEGYVPQGLTIGDGSIWVSSYRSADPKVNTGPCRVFRLEMETGRIMGQFDLPPAACTHSGGLAWLGSGRLLLADTRQIFRIDVAKALASGQAEGAMQSVKLAGELRGSFAGFDGLHAWIGTWTKDVSRARMYRLDDHLFDLYDGRSVDHMVGSVESMAIPPEVQGLSFDKHGDPWVSASNGTFGRLYHLDRRGYVLEKFEMVAGLEDIEFDSAGRLWGLSESGSRKYMDWATHFPQVFEIDVSKLR
ncbi:MAG TPA: hypothetical protein VLT89_02340 [Usitatibacter sp.]|nr:hypothetical protein [Usitatibacter sp.]